jgi:hypothetical protein
MRWTGRDLGAQLSMTRTLSHVCFLSSGPESCQTEPPTSGHVKNPFPTRAATANLGTLFRFVNSSFQSPARTVGLWRFGALPYGNGLHPNRMYFVN